MNLPFLVAAAIGASALTNLGAATALTGSGATFPAPLYQRWASDFKKVNADVMVNYQSIGSGAGVTQFLQGVTDFGASDTAMKDEEISQSKQNAVMIPATAGSIVLAYNIPGVQTGLKLSRAAFISILVGGITKWNDPAIAKANP
ncbi:MAG: substrate-binding domain-containing protein, partial [Chthoniobacterales bacterium]